MAILNSGPLGPDGYARVAIDLLEARRLKPIDYRFPLHLARLESRFAARLFDDPLAQERAATLYREAVRLAPLDPRPRLELAGHLNELKQPAEALAVVREALGLEPNFVRARLLEASILLDMERHAEARDSLRLAETTLQSLRGYVPDSGYAAEIVKDARSERERLASLLGGVGHSGERS
jgi:tetratricopeptide (TPR) repeat protein